MAQQDTGLGWSAKEEWLMQAAGSVVTFQEFGGSQFPGQPLPIVSTLADLRSVGLYAGASDLGGGVYLEWYVGIYNNEGKYSDCVAFGVYTSGSTYDVYFASPVGDADYSIFSQTYKQDGEWSNFWANQWDEVRNYDSTTGIYYARASNAIGLIEHGQSVQIPIFNSLRTGLDAIQTILTPIYKLNAGYAVAALASWYGVGGNVFVSPVLISTVKEYALLSFDGTTEAESQLTSQFLLDGLSFYFSFIPDLSGTPGTPNVEEAILLQFGAAQPKKVFLLIANSSFSNIVVIDSPDPYEEEGGSSEEDGGDGETTDDDVMGIEGGSDFPSAVNTGFCRIFSPSESELRSLSNYLWSTSYDIEQVKKLFSNPMDSILGLSAVPVRLSGSSVSFSLGGVPITGMTLPLVTRQRYTYHMGAITISERWGSYLDYDPYTKFSIFLPFIGMRELAADDIMGKTVGLVYDIDILTGMCVARLQSGSHCLYEWGGNCAIQLPINSRNWDSVFNTAVSAVGGIVSAAAAGSAPLVAGSVASAALQTVTMKPRIDKTGAIGGAAGWLGQMTPYIIRTTPEAYIPSDQNKYIGYPAYLSVALSSLTGYNEIESIHLENIPATGDELAELESILKGGVIF